MFTYVTERTFDSYSYQILENKQKFIAQIDKGDLTIRVASDIDETALSYAEIKAITTANPKIKRKMELEQEISRLRTLESEYRSNKWRLQDKINSEIPQRIKRNEITIENLKADIQKRNTNARDKFLIQLGTKTYTERKDAGEIFLAVINSGKHDNKIIGYLNGFEIITIPGTNLAGVKSVMLRSSGNYNIECSTDAVGTITRLENHLKKLDTELNEAETRLTSLNSELATAKVEVAKGFEYSDTIQSMSDELAGIDADLDLNKQEIVATVIDDEQFKDEITPIVPDEDEREFDDDGDDEKSVKKELVINPAPIMEPDLTDSDEYEIGDDYKPEFDENLESEVDLGDDYADEDDDEQPSPPTGHFLAPFGTKLVWTRTLNDMIADNSKLALQVTDALKKYCTKDWGETHPNDKPLNDAAFKNKERIVAKYDTCKGAIFIITEADRSHTTIMFADEY